LKINYIPNEEFYSLPFYVDKRVLIPRNDTEILVDRVLKEITQNTILIDVGTGSGAIPISIIKNRDIYKVFAVDISLDALEVAKINIEINNIQEKIELFHSDLLEIFLSRTEKLETQNLIITANLPYIKNGDIENMDQEVLENEPHIALFGGEKTGFEMYERLIDQIQELKSFFSGDITLYIEIGFDQYEYSKAYISNL